MSLTMVQERFLELLVRRQALRFGSFQLKSGRTSPYYINTGCFHSAQDLGALGFCYASGLREHFGDDIGLIFGPAYKGIPLALATAQTYQEMVGHDVDWAFDRKEAKDHGDSGSFVGAPLADRDLVIVDDVLTAGTALRQAISAVQAVGGRVRGALISVDRMERGRGNGRARDEIAAEYGVPVHALIGIREAADHLLAHPVAGEHYLDTATHTRIIEHIGA
ncbi:MAG: orotate phosphoribosyltransferase [Planctomycetota bacterium]